MRKRITVLAVLTSAVAVLLFAVPLAIAVARYLASDERNELQRAAATAAAAVSGDLTGIRPPTAATAERGTDLTLYSAAGAKLSGNGPASATGLARDALAGRAGTGSEGGQLVAAAPVSDGDTVTGAVMVSSNHAELNTRIAKTWAAMAAAALAAIAVTGLAARRYTRRLSAPLEHLAEVAERMGSGQRTAPAALSHISELDTVAVALNASAERLHDTIEREREFTANASHQLRTPLAGLRLELESALADRDSDARAAMTNALRATDHLEATVAALLAVARDRPTAVATAVKDVLSRAADRFTPTLAQQNRPLRVDAGDAEDLSVRSSRAGLDQMLDVLLDNASRHGRGAVHLSAHAAANAIAIDVTNEGPPIGIPSRELFARRNEHATGHGIGLPLARSLAEADGGRLNLTSTDPPTFTILLPGDPGDRTA